ncbi:hypothetical protein ASPVEDRAFT_33512 [Aspergillus versicolor CBS 583.65]|uniref:Uncharacterized protein n=1 Tax=Aspergillus versicolor CBS 583.65 TaxID=1036611 RepID=A0A1L9Q0H9_ASPVE|nr:uncharacterized protein ASPVEDRAFT_33512 [Aspergillus versicolor CBS 583.65]OJJ07281.1 hypothetical protein ASPVEDRAFT_33512 [Aspergillus versicolor CBS 583.65]
MDTSSSSTAQSTLVGWRAEPQGRGTLGLLATSLSTVFLCTWVVIHPRVHKSEVYAVPHKLALLVKTLLAPEFIAIEGLQEWAQCQRMVSECSEWSRGEFSLVHAYYISMLALRYQTPGGNRVIWPNQYTWLLKRHFIKWENHADWGLAMDQIQDKSKSDSITKLITLSQVLWFVATCIMRAANDLPLSQLESMTLSYIPLFAITYFFWWNKPKDIFSPSIVCLPAMSVEDRQHFESMALSNKFDETQDAVTYWSIWYLTPRVFEKEENDRMERAVLQPSSPKAPDVDGEMCKYRKEIVVAHWDPYLYRSKTIRSLCCLFGASFGALHLACWNTIFPTTAEMWMWRASAFVSIFSLLAFMHFEKVILRWDGLITIVKIGAPGIYFVSRVLMMGEVFAALRAVDPGVYETYEVENYGINI